MTRTMTTTLMIGLGVLLIALPAVAGKGYEKVRGEVIRVEQQTINQGSEQFITVRTRQGEEKQFRVGDAGSCADCVKVGDQIQARVNKNSAGQGPNNAAGAANAGQIQKMTVQRDGVKQGYHNESGQMVGNGGQRLQGRPGWWRWWQLRR